MERKSSNHTITELTLAAIIRVLADYLKPKTEDSSSWNLIRDDLYIDDKQECLKQILTVLSYVNPPLYGVLVGSVCGGELKVSAVDLIHIMLGDDDDEEEEGEEHDADA